MDEWVICLEECLPEFGINLDREKIASLAKILQENASCIADLNYYKCGGTSFEKEIDYKALYMSKLDEVKILTHENNVFRNSVASRHKVSTNDVNIEYDTVIVYK